MAGSVTYNLENKPCDLCGSMERELLWEKNEKSKSPLAFNSDGTLVHNRDCYCKQCGLIFKDPMMTGKSHNDFYRDQYIRIFKKTDVNNIDKNGVFIQAVNSVYRLNWLDRIGISSFSGMRILDVGSGIGMFAHALRSLGASVNMIEQSERHAKIADTLFGYQCHAVPFMEYSSLTNYHIISMCDVIEHFYSPHENLLHAHSLLAPGGYLLIETQDISRMNPAVTTDGVFSCAHTYNFTKDTLKYMLWKSGFDIVHISNSGHCGCILVLAKQNRLSTVLINTFDQSIDEIKEHIRQREEYSRLVPEVNIANVQKMIERYPTLSNNIVFQLVSMKSASGDFKDLPEFIKEYQWDFNQAEPFGAEYPDFLCLSALVLRETGDYSGYRKLMQEAERLYPRFKHYGFWKDLIIRGVISENAFANFCYYSHQYFLKQ